MPQLFANNSIVDKIVQIVWRVIVVVLRVWHADYGGNSRQRRLVRISKRTDYALRVLFHLVDRQGEGPVSITEMARRNDVPRKFLEQIMTDLRENHWVISTAGRRGGYVLGKPADQITLGEVVRFFDGVLAPIGCVSVTHFEPCSQELTCRFRRVFLDVRNFTANLMDSTTLASVHAGKPVRHEEVFAKEFVDGAGI